MDKERIKAFAGEVFADMAGAMTAGLGFIGVKTGLFQTMASKGWMTSEEVVKESNLGTNHGEEHVEAFAIRVKEWIVHHITTTDRQLVTRGD